MMLFPGKPSQSSLRNELVGLDAHPPGQVPTSFKQPSELAPKLQAKKERIKGKACCGFSHFLGSLGYIH